ncbi:MAG: phage baseplate assembly protein V [Pseudomonadota bacterium]
MRAPTAGVVIATVVANEDPEAQGRVEVRFPWLGEDSPTRWATVATAMAGANRGSFVMPEVGDEALVAFEHGDFDHPYIVGFTWNPQHTPPATDPRERTLRSLNGHNIRFVDSTESAGDRGALIIEDGHGNRIVMTNQLIRIISTGHLDIQARSVTIMGRPVNPMVADI